MLLTRSQSKWHGDRERVTQSIIYATGTFWVE